MIDYEDKWCMCSVKGSVIPKACVLASPTLIISIVLSFLDEIAGDARKESGIYDITESQLWNAMTAVIAIMLAFRTRQALGRFWEGTGLLHQMRGEWFDAASCLMAFSRDAKINKNKAAEVKEFRHTLIRLMSLMHGSALDEISGGDDDRYEVLDIHGLDQRTLCFLRDCKEKLGFNRVEALQHMIQVLVTHNHHGGVITIPPPILSRIYQTLSRGLVNLLNARKIKDTSFPFPYAQVIALLITVHSLITPLLMTQIIDNKIWAAIFSFFPILGMVTLNMIAGELEMPFGNDENDLPLRNFQSEMNEALLMLIHDFADHLPHTSRQAKFSFDALQNFARASVVERQHLGSSDSQSFMRKDFLFFDVNCEEPEKKMESESRLSEVTPPPAPETKTVIPLPPETTPRPLQTAEVVNTLQTVPETAIVLRENHTQPHTPCERTSRSMPDASARQHEVAVVEAPYPQFHKSDSCCLLRCSTPREELVVPKEGSIKQIQQSLVQMTEIQVKELKCNTETLRALLKSYPVALSQHSEAMKHFTDSICRTIDSVRLTSPSAQPVQPALGLLVTPASS